MNENPDPMKFSRHPADSEILRKGPKNEAGYQTKKSREGERFHRIENYPKTQQFVARLLKSFLHVSDIVRLSDGEYYSYEPRITDIAQSTSDSEVHAEILLLNLLFQDEDRYLDSVHPSYSHNVKRESDRHMLFDLEDTAYFWSELNERECQRAVYEKPIEACEIALDKLRSMQKYFESSGGKEQAEAAYKASGMTIEKLFYEAPRGASFEQFYEEFLKRIHLVISVIERRLKTEKEAA